MKAAVRTKRYTLMRMYSWIRGTFLAHLTQRVKWAFVIIWHPSYVLRIQQNLQQASMECPVYDYLISYRLNKNMVSMANSCFWLAANLKKWSLKLGGIMNCYYVGIVYAESCTIFPYFVLISQLIWPPYTVPVCDWTFKKKTSSQINWIL